MPTSIADARVERPPKAVVALPAATNLAARFPLPTATNRDVALDYLRAFISVLVVAVHSAAGYAVIIPASHPHHFLARWRAPIADGHRLPGVDLFLHFNDNFSMSLIFFLSGLFVRSSLARKCSAIFLRGRALCLGIPFVLALLLMPLAYYSAYRLRAIDPSFAAFWREWLSLGFWPSGPLWFVAMLLGFDALAAAVHRLGPPCSRVSTALRRPRPDVPRDSLPASWSYRPLPTCRCRSAFGADSWVKFGSFFLQTSRLLQYCVYFFVGIAVGAGDIGHSLAARGGRLARRWSAWAFAAMTMFAVDVVLIAVLPMAAEHGRCEQAG